MTANAIFILGMHRSGTSACARAINLLGAELGPELMEAAEDNQRGFWEHAAAVAAHDALLTALGHDWQDGTPLPDDWQQSEAAERARREIGRIIDRDFAAAPLWAVKDPRLSLLFPLWEPLLKERRVTPRCIVAWRNPLEVAASLQKRDGLDRDAALLCWLAYTLESLRHARPHPHAVLRYDELLTDWRGAAARMEKQLNLVWPNAAASVAAPMERFLSPSLRHHKQAMKLGDSRIERMVAAAVGLLENGGEGDAAERLRSEWQEACAVVAPSLRAARVESLALKKPLSAKTHALNDLQRQMDEMQRKYAALWQELHRLERLLQEEKHTAAELLQERAVLQTQLAAILESSSWKLTKPLRDARAALKKKTGTDE